VFDTSWYLDQNRDVARGRSNPLAHYVRWGVKEGRAPGPEPSREQVPPPPVEVALDLSCQALPEPIPVPLPELSAEPFPSVPPPAPVPPLEPASRSIPARPSRTRPGRRILFVGHDASLTGAPRILLNLVRQTSRLRGIECVTILDEGGPLEADFGEVSRLYVLGQNRHRRSSAEIDGHVAGVFKDLASLYPFVAVCNTAETAEYVRLLKKMGIPTLALVHEFLSLYQEQEPEGILDADAIVFPSEFVARANKGRLATVEHRTRVIPQGLLNPKFGEATPLPRSAVLRDYGVGDESLIVLGCGTADWRKGFDLFCVVAERVVSRLPGRDVRFCWVGKYEDTFTTAGYWGDWQLRRRGLQKALIRIWEVPDPERYFQAADIFLLTSRADPFPCVVHEAMAARLPIVAFEGAGGAPEAIRADAGVVVPYMDTGAMADAVERLRLDPAERRSLSEVGHARVHREYRFEDYGNKVIALACETAGVSRSSLAGFTPRRTPSKGRVVFAASDWSLSGVNTFTRELATYLLECGYDAEIVFTDDWALQHDRQYLPDVPFTFLEHHGGTLLDRWTVFQACMATRSPCVLIPNYDFAISSVSARLPNDVGIIGIVHSDDVDHYEHVYRLGHYWNRIVAVSEAVGNEVVRLNPAFADRTSVIHYGIDVPEVAQPGQDRGRRPPGPLRLIYVGRFVEYQKRIMDYVTLVHHLEARGVDFHLTMVGDGTCFDKVEQSLKDSIRSGRVELTGRLNQVRTRAALRNAEVLLLLSDFEGFPLVMIEALHLGCVPLVNRIRSGIPEVLADGVNGCIVEPQDWDGITRRLEQLQHAPGLLRALSCAAQATVGRCGLDRSTMGARYAAVIDGVLAEIREGRYRRPEALVPAALRGIVPSPYLYVPMLGP
jgi:glycosyltransferase involved in cell wall biosynthesis